MLIFMKIVYWVLGTRVERIYFNLPRQRLVDVWLEPVEPSQHYRWDYRIKVATNAFKYQPELREKLIQAVIAYVKHQAVQQLSAADIAQSWDEVTWKMLVDARDRLASTNPARPLSKIAKRAAAAFHAFGRPS